MQVGRGVVMAVEDAKAEPTNGELARRLDALESHIMSRLEEMDLRYQQRFDAQTVALDAARVSAKEGVDAALAAADRAVGKSEISSDKRFESVSESQKVLTDRSSSFITRGEYDTAHDALVAKVDTSSDDLSGRVGAIEGGLRAQARIQTLSIGALGAVVMLATLILTVFR